MSSFGALIAKLQYVKHVAFFFWGGGHPVFFEILVPFHISKHSPESIRPCFRKKSDIVKIYRPILDQSQKDNTSCLGDNGV